MVKSREPTYETSATGMLKHSGGKMHVELVPVRWLTQLATGMEYGAYNKTPTPYGPGNWLKGGKSSSLYAAALRHLFKWIGGENTDAESGTHHLVAAAQNCLMLEHLQHLNKLDDDREFYNPHTVKEKT